MKGRTIYLTNSSFKMLVNSYQVRVGEKLIFAIYRESNKKPIREAGAKFLRSKMHLKDLLHYSRIMSSNIFLTSEFLRSIENILALSRTA